MEEKVKDLQHRLNVAGKALELACRYNVQDNRFICRICKNYEPHKEDYGCRSCCTDGVVEYFKEQAEKILRASCKSEVNNDNI